MKKVIQIILVLLVINVCLEAQSVNKYGDFNYMFPIRCPEDHNDLLQGISLVYNSGVGNGILGVGWQITGLPTISRDITSYVNFDENDRYMYNDQRLIYNPNTGCFHTEKESFLKIEVDTIDNPATWIITAKNGTKYFFGNVQSQDNDGFIQTLNEPGKAREWRLSRVEDVYGNYIKYEYIVEEGTAYPDKITYTLNDSDSNRAVNYIKFNYEARMDVFLSYNPSKFEVQKRMQNIEIFCNDVFYKGYQIGYKEQNKIVEKSKIVSVVETDSTGSVNNEIVTFDWEETQYENYSDDNDIDISKETEYFFEDINGDGLSDIISHYYYLGTNYNPNYSMNEIINSKISNFDGSWVNSEFCFDNERTTGREILPCDINGDGLKDFVKYTTVAPKFGDAYIRVLSLISNGDGTYETVSSYEETDITVDNATEIYKNLGDINGDGLADIIIVHATDYGQFILYCLISNGDGTWQISCNCVHEVNYNTYDVIKIADVNGDSFSDIVMIGEVGGSFILSTIYSLGNGFWTLGARLVNSYSSKYFYSGDINGDGFSDIVILRRDGYSGQELHIDSYLSLGSGNWEFKEDFFERELPFQFFATNSSKIFIEDFNCDGLSDIRIIEQYNFGAPYEGLKITDVYSNGDGTWYFNEFYNDNTEQEFYLSDVIVLNDRYSSLIEINSDENSKNFKIIKKELEMPKIIGIHSKTGLSINISYKNVNEIQVTEDFKPIQVSPDSFPLQPLKNKEVVTEVVANNGIDDIDSSQIHYYQYHNGILQTGYRANRKILGFEKFKEIKSDGSFTISYSDFQESSESFEEKKEIYGIDGNLYTREIIQYQTEEIVSAQNGYPPERLKVESTGLLILMIAV